MSWFMTPFLGRSLLAALLGVAFAGGSIWALAADKAAKPGPMAQRHLKAFHAAETTWRKRRHLRSLFNVYRRADKLPEFIALLERELAASPNEPSLYLALGRAYSLARRRVPDALSKAVAMYQKAADLGIEEYSVYLQLGFLHERNRRLEEAVRCYRKGIRLAGNRRSHLANRLADVLARLGRRQEALDALKASIAASQNSAWTQANAARVYQRLGEMDLAINHMRKAVALAQDARRRVQYQGQLVAIYAAAGRVHEAEQGAKRLLDEGMVPRGRKRVLRRLRQSLLARGAEQAVAELQKEIGRLAAAKAASLHPRAWRQELAADILLEELNQPGAALAAYEATLRLAPDNGAVLDKIRRLREETEKARRAVQALINDKGLLWRRDDPFVKNVVWLAFPAKLVRVDMNGGARTEFTEFLGQDAFKPLSIEFCPERVWLGTDHGVFAYERRHGYWNRYAIDRELLDVAVDEIEIQDDGIVLFRVIGADGARRRYAFDLTKGSWENK